MEFYYHKLVGIVIVVPANKGMVSLWFPHSFMPSNIIPVLLLVDSLPILIALQINNVVIGS